MQLWPQCWLLQTFVRNCIWPALCGSCITSRQSCRFVVIADAARGAAGQCCVRTDATIGHYGWARRACKESMGTAPILADPCTLTDFVFASLIVP